MVKTSEFWITPSPFSVSFDKLNNTGLFPSRHGAYKLKKFQLESLNHVTYIYLDGSRAVPISTVVYLSPNK